MTDVPPRVSVIIPCYNSARFVHRAIKTALGQTYKDVEVIVVDDCSTDDLEKAIQPYLEKIIFFHHLTNSGPSVTRNTGVGLASGSILAFLDADDWWPDDLLERLLPLVSNERAVCYDNFIVTEDKADRLGDADLKDTLLADWLSLGPKCLDYSNMEKIFTIPSLFKIIMTRHDFERVDGFDARFFGIEDFHFFVKLLAQGVNIRIAPEPKGYYLVQQGSILRTIKRDSQRQLVTLQEWRLMFSIMPKELPLNENAIHECRRRSNYYRARSVDTLLRQSLATGSYRNVMSHAFLRDAGPAVPDILRFKIQGLVRRLQERFVKAKA